MQWAHGSSAAASRVRPVNLSYQTDMELLNSGRMSADYLGTQLPRLRESFYLYGLGLMQ